MTAEERAALLADLHTTVMGEERIRRNAAPDAVIERRGKNFYITSGGCTLTVHAGSHTVITAHRLGGVR